MYILHTYMRTHIHTYVPTYILHSTYAYMQAPPAMMNDEYVLAICSTYIHTHILQIREYVALHWDLKAKLLTSGGELVDFNKRYQNTKKIHIYIEIMAILTIYCDYRNLILLYFITITSE